MLKYVESAITFSEFPNEIALAINLSLCPNKCKGCSESYLAEDTGVELTTDLLDELIAKNSGITLVGFMGGDNDHEAIETLTRYIQSKHLLKVGMYSGRNWIDLSLANVLDYYKVGSWIIPEGTPEEWHKRSCGPLNFPFSNQKMYRRDGNKLIDITEEFRKDKVNNYEREIIR